MVLVFDWAREQWTSLPASLELAVVPKLLGQPVRFGLNPIYDLRELPGNEHWKINLALTILAPPATRGATAAGGGGNEATARPRR